MPFSWPSSFPHKSVPLLFSLSGKPVPPDLLMVGSPSKSQLRCQCLWQVAGGHLSRLAPLEPSGTEWKHTFRVERINVLSKPPPDYSDKEYTWLTLEPRSYFCKETVLAGVSRLFLSNRQCGKHQPGAASCRFFPHQKGCLSDVDNMVGHLPSLHPVHSWLLKQTSGEENLLGESLCQNNT